MTQLQFPCITTSGNEYIIHFYVRSSNAHMFLCGEADLRGYQPANKGDGRENEDHWYKYASNFVCKTLDGSLHG